MKKTVSFIMLLLIVMNGTFTACSKNHTESNTKDSDSGKTQYRETTGTEDEYTDSMVDAKDSENIGTFSNGSMNSMMISEDKMSEYDMSYNMPNTEEYTKFIENGYKDTIQNPLSTFSIDVDTASYANIRKNINYGIIPDVDSVRIEEMLNYFSYDYKEPIKDRPFSINTEIGKCPWNDEHYLMTIGVQGIHVDKENLPKSNLVFLIDVSGSMDEPDKLPLLKRAFSQLVEVLGEDDRVSIVVYAGETGVALDGVNGSEKRVILDAIDSLSAGGSTAGASGIELAYRLATKNFRENGNNRVILATDGDFNVGPSSLEELQNIIEEKRESGIYLSVMGFGLGNLKDNNMELLADKGNGNYSYIDSEKEAKKVLVDEMAGTLLTIAKDVKIQLEFNPNSVQGYRLIGYENRALKDEEFKDDTVDAGEVGAGHSVTAIYEIIPSTSNLTTKEELKYQTQETVINKEYRNEISEIRIRYKEPIESESKEIVQVVTFENTPVKNKKHSEDFYFIAAVAEFGMLLRNSEYKGNSDITSILTLAKQGVGEDKEGYRKEFISLVKQYKEITNDRW